MTDGTKIVDGEMKLDGLTELDGGFLLAGNDDGTWLFYPDGISKKISDSKKYMMVSYNETEAYIVEKGENVALGNSIAGIGYEWLAKDRDSSYKVALYNLMNGEKLLDYDYKSIDYYDGFVYAKKDDVYEVYRVDIHYPD